MKQLVGLLIAAVVMAMLPASAQAWGNTPAKAIGPWETVKKPYTLGWGHCTKCGTCSGGTCVAGDTTCIIDDGVASGSTQLPDYNQDMIQGIKNNYLAGYGKPALVIDCSGTGNSAAAATLDCSGSSPFYDIQQPSRYAIKFSFSSNGKLVK